MKPELLKATRLNQSWNDRDLPEKYGGLTAVYHELLLLEVKTTSSIVDRGRP